MKFEISLNQAMEFFSLKPGFTEKEFKVNYKKLMMGIHPDALGNINPIARKILEDEARKANLAKEVIESYLKGEYSNYNVNKNSSYYKRDNTNNNTHEQQRREGEYREHQRSEKEYQEQRTEDSETGKQQDVKGT